MKLHIILLILFMHWVADFVCQTDEMAANKSSSNKWLSLHVAAYTSVILCLGVFILPPIYGFIWAVTNGAIHWVQDYFTSRINKRLWASGRRHAFYVSFGADQYIHFAFLLSTLYLIFLTHGNL